MNLINVSLSPGPRSNFTLITFLKLYIPTFYFFPAVRLISFQHFKIHTLQFLISYMPFLLKFIIYPYTRCRYLFLQHLTKDSSFTFTCCFKAAWFSGLHIWLVMWRSWVRAPSKAPVVSLSKKLYPNSLELVGSRNGFERDFTIELK